MKKLALVVVDSMRHDKLAEAAADGVLPNFSALLREGTVIEDCVSAFPSVTPVACAEIATGVTADRHWIPGMNWYHRAEGRYVEYGSSLEATRACGLFRTLYDTVYNMNMAHLSPEAETVFERLGDAGVRTACTPFLIYRGRRRHELGLDGLMRRVAVAARFRHAVWGPDELFYGELYASRKVPCKPTLARPGTRDEYSACVGRALVEAGAYDFLLFSLPDNDHHAHSHGVRAMPQSLAHADRCFGELVDAAGGMREFLDSHSVILAADHAQTDVARELPLAKALGDRWRVLRPSSELAGSDEIAVSPTARAAGVYVLADGRRARAVHAGVRAHLAALEGVDLVAWLGRGDGSPPDGDELARARAGEASSLEAIVERRGRQLRFRPGGSVADERGAGWDLEGDLGALDAEVRDGLFSSLRYPDALTRLWAALHSPHAGDILLSLADGYECVDWGAASHLGGASHGALSAADSLAPLVLVDVGDGSKADRRWALRDLAGLVLGHFGVAAPQRPLAEAVA